MVPPALMQQMMRGAASSSGAPASGPPAQGPSAPAQLPAPAGIGGPMGGPPRAAPLSAPQPKKGLQNAGRTNIHIAVNMLEEALPAFGSESDEGKDILKALSILGKHVARKDSQDLVPAEIMQLVSRASQMGGGTAIQRQLAQQMRGPAPVPPTPGGPPNTAAGGGMGA